MNKCYIFYLFRLPKKLSDFFGVTFLCKYEITLLLCVTVYFIEILGWLHICLCVFVKEEKVRRRV